MFHMVKGTWWVMEINGFPAAEKIAYFDNKIPRFINDDEFFTGRWIHFANCLKIRKNPNRTGVWSFRRFLQEAIHGCARSGGAPQPRRRR
jgi:hypothetical protein